MLSDSMDDRGAHITDGYKVVYGGDSSVGEKETKYEKIGM
jgi:hypothetical protein